AAVTSTPDHGCATDIEGEQVRTIFVLLAKRHGHEFYLYLEFNCEKKDNCNVWRTFEVVIGLDDFG
ncbi:unnamed protein product, partial [Amoebophrya sp. A25]